MSDLKGKKFVASYSGGKDSVLAIYRAINLGLIPLELIMTYNTGAKRSWFHVLPADMIKKAGDSLGLPIQLVKTPPELYESNFEKALADAVKRGAEVCIFGDIDLEGHLKWCTERCEKTGLIPFFPLLKESRKKVVHEFIERGFLSMITIVDTSRLPERFLGQILSKEIIEEIENCGADICGENGEYHTFTFNGPLFTRAIDFAIKGREKRDKYAVLVLE